MKPGKICIIGDTAYYTRVKRDDNEIAVNPEIIERNTKRIRRTIKKLKKSKDTKVIESRSRWQWYLLKCRKMNPKNG